MRNNEDDTRGHADAVLEELWGVKDYYSLSCRSDFRVLLEMVREDLAKLAELEEHEVQSHLARKTE